MIDYTESTSANCPPEFAPQTERGFVAAQIAKEYYCGKMSDPTASITGLNRQNVTVTTQCLFQWLSGDNVASDADSHISSYAIGAFNEVLTVHTWNSVFSGVGLDNWHARLLSIADDSAKGHNNSGADVLLFDDAENYLLALDVKSSLRHAHDLELGINRRWQAPVINFYLGVNEKNTHRRDHWKGNRYYLDHILANLERYSPMDPLAHIPSGLDLSILTGIIRQVHAVTKRPEFKRQGQLSHLTGKVQALSEMTQVVVRRYNLELY